MTTTEDYQAAERLLRRPARPGELVVGDKVRPQWIDGGARFRYAVSTGAGRRFVLTAPAAGTREPAFDHARLAAAPAVAAGEPADQLVAADKAFELIIVPGAEHTFIDCLAYVRRHCWDFLVRELLGAHPPAYRPAPIPIGPEVLAEMFA
jgi:hypothetical protein